MMIFSLLLLVSAIGLSFLAFVAYTQSRRDWHARLNLVVVWLAAAAASTMALLDLFADPEGRFRTFVLIAGATSTGLLLLAFWVMPTGEENNA